MSSSATSRYIGLMSGTSLDGVDAALVDFAPRQGCRVEARAFLAFPEPLKRTLLELNTPGNNEIERSQLAGNHLARLYADCISALLRQSGVTASAVNAIGCHGQTIRHRPDLGFTVQIGNAALLAELTGIRIVADFRSRDIAAGGQGAPLVPAFHRAVFGDAAAHRTIINIGGISNLSDLPPTGAVCGFDCGPGNILMDGWAQRHIGSDYDKDGAWAASGQVIPELLHALLDHPYFNKQPPKSTGRDDFNLAWLESHVAPGYPPADVQATLLELTARTISAAVDQHCCGTRAIYLCGGGAYNKTLLQRLQQLLGSLELSLSDDLGIPATIVEAAAFAWLAQQTMLAQAGNLPEVTGAAGPRILGAIYPA